jgi:hypothetical protein
MARPRAPKAKVLLEKNGGGLQFRSFGEGKVQVRIGFLKA